MYLQRRTNLGSIFRKLSYVKSNLKIKKIKNKNMELEFHVKFLTLLDFHQIKFFFFYIETQFSKNRVSKQGHFTK